MDIVDNSPVVSMFQSNALHNTCLSYMDHALYNQTFPPWVMYDSSPTTNDFPIFDQGHFQTMVDLLIYGVHREQPRLPE